MSGALESEFLQSIARNRIQQVCRVLVLVLLEAYIFWGGGLGVAALRLLFLQRNWSAKCPEILERIGCLHWLRSGIRRSPLSSAHDILAVRSVLQCEEIIKIKNPKKHLPVNYTNSPQRWRPWPKENSLPLKTPGVATRVYASSND